MIKMDYNLIYLNIVLLMIALLLLYIEIENYILMSRLMKLKEGNVEEK